MSVFGWSIIVAFYVDVIVCCVLAWRAFGAADGPNTEGTP